MISKKTKQDFELTDSQFKILQDYCSQNYPLARFGPDDPEPEEPEKPPDKPSEPIKEKQEPDAN